MPALKALLIVYSLKLSVAGGSVDSSGVCGLIGAGIHHISANHPGVGAAPTSCLGAARQLLLHADAELARDVGAESGDAVISERRIEGERGGVLGARFELQQADA